MAPRGAPRAGLLAGGAVLLCLVAAARGAYRGRRQTYWFNEVTKVTQWEEPPKHEFIDGEPPPGRRAAPRGEPGEHSAGRPHALQDSQLVVRACRASGSAAFPDEQSLARWGR